MRTLRHELLSQPDRKVPLLASRDLTTWTWLSAPTQEVRFLALAMGKKKAVAAPAPAPAPKPINQRGTEYQAEKLTGNRAVQGKLPTGGPRYVYEVKWAGINSKTKRPWPCSFEPAGCLIGWEAQMKAVDAAIEGTRIGNTNTVGNTNREHE